MISIIVPIYNVAPYLPSCLDSLVNQTYRELEIICVNDGSTDGSLAILKEYAKKDERIKVINQANQGISASRNEALDIAQGEWTMFVDSDDWIDVTTCQTALDTALHHQADVVLWAYTREYEHQSLPKLYLDKETVWDKDIRTLQRRMIGPVGVEVTRPDTLDSWGTLWGKLYRTSYIQQEAPIRMVDTNRIGTCEDVLFNIAYMGRIQKAVYIPQALYHYRKGNSYTATYKADLPQKWEALYQEIAKELQIPDCVPDFIEAYYNRISIGIIGLGLNELFAQTSLKKKYHRISQLLDRPIYREAIQSFPTDYLPIHWKVFFGEAKHNRAWLVFVMLTAIQKIITK